MTTNTDNLFAAIIRDDITTVRALLNTPGINVNMENANGYTPLMEAVSYSLRIVRLLLAVPGIDINHRSSTHFDTAFLKTAINTRDDSVAMVQLFLADNRLDVNTTDAYGFTPLIKAVAFHNLPIVQALLADPRVDVNYEQPSTKQTALHLSIMYGALPEAEALLANDRVNVNATDIDWETPLMYIAARRQITLLPIILANPRIDVYIRNKQGYNAVDVALKNGDIQMAESILKKINLRKELFNRQLIGRKGQKALNVPARVVPRTTFDWSNAAGPLTEEASKKRKRE